jgi:transposase
VQIESIQKRISELDTEIKTRIAQQERRIEHRHVHSGIGLTVVAIILAEIGDYRDFDKPEKLASLAGLVSAVYQSAGSLLLKAALTLIKAYQKDTGRGCPSHSPDK